MKYTYVLPTSCIRFIVEDSLSAQEREILDSFEFSTYYNAAYVIDFPRTVETSEIEEIVIPLALRYGVRILVLQGWATNPYPGTWGDGHPDAETFRIHPRTLVVVRRNEEIEEEVMDSIGQAMLMHDPAIQIWKYVRLIPGEPVDIDAMSVQKVIVV